MENQLPVRVVVRPSVTYSVMYVDPDTGEHKLAHDKLTLLQAMRHIAKNKEHGFHSYKVAEKP